MTAFEALTVIENLEYLPGDEVLQEEIQKIEKSISSASENKKYFLNGNHCSVKTIKLRYISPFVSCLKAFGDK